MPEEIKTRARLCMEKAMLKHRAKQLNLNKQFEEAKEIEKIIMAYA